MSVITPLAHEAENIRKLLLAMGADIRVLLVKLADRLQDMLSLDAVDEEESCSGPGKPWISMPRWPAASV